MEGVKNKNASKYTKTDKGENTDPVANIQNRTARAFERHQQALSSATPREGSTGSHVTAFGNTIHQPLLLTEIHFLEDKMNTIGESPSNQAIRAAMAVLLNSIKWKFVMDFMATKGKGRVVKFEAKPHQLWSDLSPLSTLRHQRK